MLSASDMRGKKDLMADKYKSWKQYSCSTYK